MDLQVVWFVVVAVFWTGFFVLEGFDFGVGVLHRFLGRDDLEKRVAINTIGPFWDGNEVWLVVGGAAVFAAFPPWYATWFSAGYLALVLVLVALILRGVSFEFRGHRDSPRWRAGWSWTLTIGSALAPLLLGVALGDLLAGLPVDDAGDYAGTFWNLLTPYGLYLGVTLLALCLWHGATFLGLRTTGELHARAHRVAVMTAVPCLALLIGLAVWTPALGDAGVWRGLLPSLAALVAGVVAAVALRSRAEGLAFTATAFAIGLSVLSVFANLYPNVLVSTAGANLTVANSASSQYALQVMTVVAAIFFPVVLLYQGWSYVVFRRRLTVPPDPTITAPAEGAPA